MVKIKPKELFEQICEVVMNADRPSAFLEAICDFTVADAGSLWSNQDTTLSKDIFILRTVHNRPNAVDFVDVAFFDIRDSDAVASNAFASKKPIIGNIGPPPFDENWLSKDYTSDLRLLKIKMIAVIPVFDINENPIHVLSLYFKSSKEIDPDILLGISSLLTSTSEAIDKRLRNARLERRKDRHEVMAHTRIIASKLAAIKKDLTNNISMITNSKIILNRYDDTIRSLNVLRRSYESSSFKERVNDRHNHTSYINIKKELNNILRSTIKEFSGKNNIAAGDVICNKLISILFHKEDFTMIFSNLYSNAAKYSISGSTIRTMVVNQENFIKISIRNDISISASDDLAKIWEYEERGASILDKNIPGEGLGLGLVADICDVYGINFEAEYETNRDKKYSKVFCVTLIIPNDM